MQITFKKATLINASMLVTEEISDISAMFDSGKNSLPTAADLNKNLTVSSFKNFGVLDSNGDITVTINEEFLIKYLKITLSFYKAMAPAVMIAVSAFKMFISKMDSFVESFSELKEVAAEKKEESTTE